MPDKYRLEPAKILPGKGQYLYNNRSMTLNPQTLKAA
jgi:hypothetical protein